MISIPRKNDTVAHTSVFQQYRSLLFSIAYRMLGSVADAEDMVQETFLRWQSAALDDIASPRAFLVTIISRLCINHLQSSRVRREEYVGQWLPEPIATGSGPSDLLHLNESLSMAFLVLLERLTPVERAVFLLREVFEYEYVEIAEMLERSEAACRQSLSRARKHVQAVRPRHAASTQKKHEMLELFLHATTSGDMGALLSLLATDVTLHADGGSKGLAVPNAIFGADHVARGVMGALMKLVPQQRTTRIIEINGAPGLVSYLDGKPFSALTLEIVDGVIQKIFVVTNPQKLARLP